MGEGQPHSEVYIAGTNDWGVGSSPDPFDMQSNIALVAGLLCRFPGQRAESDEASGNYSW